MMTTTQCALAATLPVTQNTTNVSLKFSFFYDFNLYEMQSMSQSENKQWLLRKQLSRSRAMQYVVPATRVSSPQRQTETLSRAVLGRSTGPTITKQKSTSTWRTRCTL